ncbi:fumarylacetoacetate hydrolase family protein [Burkholderia cenocepacia]|uniref:fumarylacetoacetate hydrolase family protein n=1 Tax=Burkholderia cenocepacia TaxID=95486 RepID=UPI001B932480|nr:fumarylacetoacetate hydrolase family protein [Burkholderia cenocepacia]MBR8094895.1 fumarylacetoacetate hydrolase family protein [Burkholderia cenocepacia]
MKLCRFNEDRVGIVRGDQVFDVTNVLEGRPSPAPWARSRGDWLIANLSDLRVVLEHAATVSKAGLPLSSVSLLSPVANPSKIMGAPGNYLAHVDEVNTHAAINFGIEGKTIDHYGLFLKANSSLIGPSEGVRIRFADRRSDYEGELAVIIGREGSQVAELDALEYVAGYAASLDMTVRGAEERSLRKSVDSYSVLGPWLTTPDEIADPDGLLLRLELNGEERQHCSTSQLIFGVAKLIAYASSFYTLYPGDIIMTGTPSGVGAVASGDVIRIAIDNVGAMNVAIY